MYFTWKKFAFQAPCERHTQVVIVGAGPVGLVTALSLARQGIRPVILEQRDQVSDGSRSIAMTRRTMQILDSIGVGRRVLDKALLWDSNSVHFGDRLVYAMTLAQPPSEVHQMTNLQQCWVEQILLDALAEQHSLSVCWQNELIDLKQDDDRVVLTVRTPDGSSYDMTADHVVAADGPRGRTRKALGLEYQGARYEQRFIITDYMMKSPRPGGRKLWFSPPYAPGTTVLQHKGPFDFWRLDYQLRDDEDADAEVKPERVRYRLEQHLKMIGETTPYEIQWISIYRANAINLPAYQVGRVSFTGDAAHQMPIFGGRGVNNGYLDAINLAWKLAYVLRRNAAPTLLESYDRERQPAIESTIKELSKVTLYMTTPSPGLKLLRQAVLSLSLSESFVHKLFEPFSVPRYNRLPDAAGPKIDDQDAAFEGGPPVGMVPPEAATTHVDGRAGRLFEEFGTDFTCLAFCGPSGDGIAQLFDDIGHLELPLRRVAIGLAAAPDIAHADARLCSPAAFGLYGAVPGAVYLIRPDHHVVARWISVDSPRLAAAIRAAAHLDGASEVRHTARDVPSKPLLSPVEQDFDLLQHALAAVDDSRRDLFLAKLALLLSNEIADKKAVAGALARAAKDL
jgi:3-(3-hydroxy-phenyl)propionate hydroxylase